MRPSASPTVRSRQKISSDTEVSSTGATGVTPAPGRSSGAHGAYARRRRGVDGRGGPACTSTTRWSSARPPTTSGRSSSTSRGGPSGRRHLREVVPFDGGPLVVGGGVRVCARNLPAREWRVVEVRPHRGFTWREVGVGSTVRLGVRITANRRAPASGSPRSAPVGSVHGRRADDGSTRPVHVEELADALRRRCESGAARCRPPHPLEPSIAGIRRGADRPRAAPGRA